MAQQGDDHTWQTERLRDLLNSEHRSDVEQQQRALEALEQEMSERSALGGLANLDRRRRDFDTHARDQEANESHDPIHPHSSPAAILRARRRAFRPSQRLLRHREAYNDAVRAEQTNSVTNPRRATPPFGYSEAFTDHYLNPTNEEREQRYRSKRRKLDDGTFDDESKVVPYGDKGRVTPGPLRMELVSCDGGEYDEPLRGAAQLVLQDDSSVYSTKSNGCNILIKHAGGAPFSLTKMVFKAPRDGYDAPIREGMIFVAMGDESLLAKTSQYEVKYSPRSYHHHHHHHHHYPPRRGEVHRPSQEYMNSTRSPLRSIDRSRASRESYPHHPWLQHAENSSELETALIPGFEISFADPSDSEDVPSQSPLSPHRWREEDSSRPGRPYADRYRPVYTDDLSYAELSGTSDDSEDPDVVFRRTASMNPSDRFYQRHRTLSRIRPHRSVLGDRNLYDRLIPNADDWQDLNLNRGPQQSQPGSNESMPQTRSLDTQLLSDPAKSLVDRLSAVGDQSTAADTLAPHARFLINSNKSSVAVNFEPPVSGRYILVKLWAGCPNANVDIQSIIAHGYGGPRFFPAQEFR